MKKILTLALTIALSNGCRPSSQSQITNINDQFCGVRSNLGEKLANGRRLFQKGAVEILSMGAGLTGEKIAAKKIPKGAELQSKNQFKLKFGPLKFRREKEFNQQRTYAFIGKKVTTFVTRQELRLDKSFIGIGGAIAFENRKVPKNPSKDVSCFRVGISSKACIGVIPVDASFKVEVTNGSLKGKRKPKVLAEWAIGERIKAAKAHVVGRVGFEVDHEAPLKSKLTPKIEKPRFVVGSDSELAAIHLELDKKGIRPKWISGSVLPNPVFQKSLKIKAPEKFMISWKSLKDSCPLLCKPGNH